MYIKKKRKRPATMCDQLLFSKGSFYNNQSSILIKLDINIDIDRLKRTAELLLIQNPIINYRYIKHWFRPYWDFESIIIQQFFSA